MLMATLTSKHRLQSNAFVRMDDDKKIAPKRMVFLSVEGERTETDYFRHLDVYLDNSIIRVEVLRHKRGDGYSDPQYVIELLDEYINVRQGELIPEDSAQQLIQKYSEEVIRAYLEDINSIPTTVQKQICEDLVLIGIDIDYRRYLQQYSSADDMFAVVIDRDCGNHSRELMEECVRKCQEKNYGIYVTNPCFEFWLLLHLCDV